MNKPIQLLLAEDSPEDARFFLEVLEETCIEANVVPVEDGVELLAYLRHQGKYAQSIRPDVIVLDLNMPRKNGHEVLLEMRRDQTLEPIPVILLTVSQSSTDVQTAMHLKMNFYLNKPVQPKALQVILQTISSLWLSTNV